MPFRDLPPVHPQITMLCSSLVVDALVGETIWLAGSRQFELISVYTVPNFVCRLFVPVFPGGLPHRGRLCP